MEQHWRLNTTLSRAPYQFDAGPVGKAVFCHHTVDRVDHGSRVGEPGDRADSHGGQTPVEKRRCDFGGAAVRLNVKEFDGTLTFRAVERRRTDGTVERVFVGAISTVDAAHGGSGGGSLCVLG
ncbi:MAG: hypothetical protein PPP55_06930 [Halorubrum sp.]